METPLSSLTLPVVDDKGKPLDPRVKNVDSARALWVKTRDADLESNRQMAKVQALLDGAPPHDQAKLNSSGQGFLSNFNPGDAKAALDQALSPYVDLISADVRVIDVFTRFGDDKNQQVEWSDIMSEELGNVLRSWPLFTFRYAFIPSYSIWHGVAVAYFEDCYDWRWNVTHLGYFKIPRQTLASEDEIEYGFTKVNTQPHNILKYLKNEAAAEAEGWKVEAAKSVLCQATSQTADVNNWLEFEAEWKNNDLYQGETAPTIPIIHMWVRECDGSYSLYMFSENGDTKGQNGKDDFIFCKRHAFKSAHEAFVLFTRGIGTNGTYHSIRGLGADMYNAYQALMRLENRKVDIASLVGPAFQPDSEESMQAAQVTPYGPYMLVSPGLNLLQVQPPNISQSIEPAIASLRATVTRNSGAYGAPSIADAGRERTRAEVMAELEQKAQLSVTSLNLYYQAADRLAQQVVKRMVREGYQRGDPGGQQVWEWKERCMERGVPAKCFSHLDHRKTRASRVIGAGSPAARRVALESLMTLYPLYDDVGKQEVVRRLTAATVGWENADAIAPKTGPRVPVDAQIAELQNDVLAQGTSQVSVSPNENKRVHLEVHVGKINEYVAMFEQAGQNPDLFAEIVPPMERIYQHAAETLESYTGNDRPQFNQALQQAGEILVNGVRHLQKLQEQQAEQAMAAGEGQAVPDQAAQLNNELERRVIEHQQKLEFAAQEHRLKMEQKIQEAALDRQLKAADTAAEIGRKTAQQRIQQTA